MCSPSHPGSLYLIQTSSTLSREPYLRCPYPIRVPPSKVFPSHPGCPIPSGCLHPTSVPLFNPRCPRPSWVSLSCWGAPIPFGFPHRTGDAPSAKADPVPPEWLHPTDGAPSYPHDPPNLSILIPPGCSCHPHQWPCSPITGTHGWDGCPPSTPLDELIQPHPAPPSNQLHLSHPPQPGRDFQAPARIPTSPFHWSSPGFLLPGATAPALPASPTKVLQLLCLKDSMKRLL